MEKLQASEWINNKENISITKYIAQNVEMEHTHDFIEMEYIFQGGGCQVINGVSHYVERGDLLFFNFEDRHSIMPENEIGIINCILNPEFVSEELINSENALDILTLSCFKDFDRSIHAILPRIKFSGRDIVEIDTLMNLMLQEFDEKSMGYIAILKGYTHVLLTKVMRAVIKSDGTNIASDMKKIAPEVLKFIEKNYNRKLLLSELAKIGFYNPSYFSKMFKECYGKTVTEYINGRRMEAAIKLLAETTETIESICFQVGYKDKKQFYNLFKEYTLMTPDKYRVNIKRNPTTR